MTVQTQIDAIGSVQARIVVKTLRKQGRLAVHMTPAEATAITQASAKLAIRAALDAGKIDAEALAALIAWAEERVQSASDTEAPSMQTTVTQAAESRSNRSLPGSESADPASMLRTAFEALGIKSQATIDHDQIRAIVREALDAETSKPRPMAITITRPDGTVHKLKGTQHAKLPRLIRALNAGCSVMLTGPAGSGKTTGAEQAAEALALPFRSISVCGQTPASTLLGYMDAQGRYVRTAFREAYELGAVFLLDEMDAGNPNVLAVLNSALANGACEFPDARVKRHENFRCVAACNTYGTGRTSEYVGRNPIDAATLDRFVVIEWGYDETIERERCADALAWAAFVQAFRAAVNERGIKHIVSPRASIHGAAMLKAGESIDNVIESVLVKGMDASAASAIVASIGKPSVERAA